MSMHSPIRMSMRMSIHTAQATEDKLRAELKKALDERAQAGEAWEAKRASLQKQIDALRAEIDRMGDECTAQADQLTRARHPSILLPNAPSNVRWNVPSNGPSNVR